MVWGVRSPAALELCRQLACTGIAVEGADFLHAPLGRFSNCLQGYHRLPGPRQQPAQFKARARALLARGYRAVFACNEELFWLAGAFPGQGYWPRLDLLRRLHRKDWFVEELRLCGLAYPETLPWQEPAAREWARRSPHEVVLKPVYSRFGEDVYIAPSLERQARIKGDWVVQRCLHGESLCFTGFALRGELVLGCSYRNLYSTLRQGSEHGHRGAGIYFERLERPDLTAYAARLVEGCGYHGPISLDFIDCPGGPVAVECNPRWTSGIHLLDLRPVFEALHLGSRIHTYVAPARAQLAALTLTQARAPWGRFLREWKAAPDVISRPGDRAPGWGQLLSLAELAGRSLRQGISLNRASTWDIEWNGEDIADV